MDVVGHTSNLHRIPPYLGLGRAGSEVKGFVGPRKQMPERLLKSKTFRAGIYTKVPSD